MLTGILIASTVALAILCICLAVSREHHRHEAEKQGSNREKLLSERDRVYEKLSEAQARYDELRKLLGQLGIK